jgi:hypothetical protein
MTLETLSRRQFLGSTAKASALTATFLAGGVSIPALATPVAIAPNADLLFALGQKIAQEAIVALGSEQVGLVYFDHAGASLDPLREGMEQVLSREAKHPVQAREVPASYGAILGAAVFTERNSGAQVRMEIFAAALTQLDMIQGVTASASLQKHAVMAASADSFYSVA